MISANIFFSENPLFLKISKFVTHSALWVSGHLQRVWAVIELIGFPPQWSCSSQKWSLDLKEISGKAID